MAEQFGKFVRGINLGQEGDGVDRLHFGKVPMACMACSALLLLMKNFKMTPIACWLPFEQGLSENWAEYLHFYCYVSNTFVPTSRDIFAKNITQQIDAGEIVYLRYYQWVPLIFISVAVMFYMPRLLWQGILEAEGINVTAMVKSVNGFENAMKSADRDRQLTNLAKYLRAHFTCKKQESKNTFKRILGKVCFFARSDSSYLGRMYLVLKFLEVTVSCGMLFILNVWLDSYHFYGIDVLLSLFRGHYSQTTAFPLLSICEATQRALTDNKTVRFQCLLPLNMFNEKIFTLFWFFLVYVAIVTLLNAFFWSLKVLQSGNRERYIRTLLRLSKSANIDFDDEKDKTLIKDFINKFVKADGVFTFRLINANTSTVVMHEIVGRLWNMWKDDQMEKLKGSNKTLDSNRMAR